MLGITVTTPIQIEIRANPDDLRRLADRLESLKCGDPCKILDYQIGTVDGRAVSFVLGLDQ